VRVTWPALDGARYYRLELIDFDTRESLRQIGPLTSPTCEFTAPRRASACRLGGSLFWRSGRLARWQRHGPPGLLLGTPVHTDTEAAGSGGAAVNHVQIRDLDRGEMLQDEVVLGDPVLRWADCELSHHLRHRITPWTGAGWGDPGDWRLPPSSLLLGPAHSQAPPLGPGAHPSTLLLFTIDTEGGVHRLRDPDPKRVVDELVFGGSDRLGIEFHMDILEHFGAKGCFFLDVLMEYSFGASAVQRIVETIRSRGHEIQLHVHADHLLGAGEERLRSLGNALGSDDHAAFAALIELAVELFERRGGGRPLADRAGGVRGAPAPRVLLAPHGIHVDASVQTWFNSRVSDWIRSRTQPHWIGELLEVPPTWYLHETEAGDHRPYAFAPIAGNTSAACVTNLRSDGPEPSVVTYVSHSFQLLRTERIGDPHFRRDWIARLEQLSSSEQAARWSPPDGHAFTVNEPAPDDEMVASAVRALRAIADRSDATFTTYAELWRAATEGDWWRGPRLAPVDPVPTFDATTGRGRTRAIRVYSADLARRHSELAPEPPPAKSAVRSAPLPEIAAAIAELAPGAETSITCNVLCSPADTVPPLASLLFSDAALGREPSGPALDVPSLATWLAQQGVEVQSVSRTARPASELRLLEHHAARLRGLDPAELGTAAATFVLRRLGAAPQSPPLADRAEPPEPEDKPPDDLQELTIEQLELVAARAYARTKPGDELSIRLAVAAPLSPTTVLAALLRAGFEILGADPNVDGLACRLARPLELADIERFVHGR